MSDPNDRVGLTAESTRPAADQRRFFSPLGYIVLGVILFMMFGVAFNPMPSGNGYYRAENAWTQTARAIGLAMYSYANDNDGNYPDGKSSTEVFQALLDGGYVNDPNSFYIPLPGKIKPVTGQKLKPENVSWDVTSGVDSHAPDGLPVLFMTGYKVTYAPGGSAVPIITPSPQFELTWSQWWHHGQLPISPGIAIFYKGYSFKFMKLDTTANSGGSIHNFVPLDFDPKGKTYRQLTPNGPLPGN